MEGWKTVPGGPTATELEHWGVDGVNHAYALRAEGHPFSVIKRIPIETLKAGPLSRLVELIQQPEDESSSDRRERRSPRNQRNQLQRQEGATDVTFGRDLSRVHCAFVAPW